MKKDRTGIFAIGIAAAATLVVWLVSKARAEPEPGLANLYGKVTDSATGQSILGALVTLNGQQAQTDSSGNYKFLNLEPGTYQVVFVKDSYHPVTV